MEPIFVIMFTYRSRLFWSGSRWVKEIGKAKVYHGFKWPVKLPDPLVPKKDRTPYDKIQLDEEYGHPHDTNARWYGDYCGLYAAAAKAVPLTDALIEECSK